MTRLYFSHPVSDFGTPFEDAVVSALQQACYEVVNPNSPEHQAAYAKGGFKYTKEVRSSCEAIAFLRFPNGKLGSGVAAEIADFRKRDLPIYEIDPTTFALTLTSGPVLGSLDAQFTRLETEFHKALPNGGRAVGASA